MSRFTPILGICLALTLALTGGAMVIARGQAMAAGTIVLCTGAGPVSVAVDADGQPIGTVHICPDCALHLIDAAAPPVPGLQAPGGFVLSDIPVQSTLAAASRATAAKARAPPRA